MGLHTAIGLAARGVRVVTTLREPSRSDALRAAAAAAGVRLDIRPLDATDHRAAADCVEDVLGTYGQVYILINNAGRGRWDRSSSSRWTACGLSSRSITGVAALTKLVLPPMRLAGSGRIVTVTSVGGVVGQPFADAYCAAKFAVERAEAVAGTGRCAVRYRRVRRRARCGGQRL